MTIVFAKAERWAEVKVWEIAAKKRQRKIGEGALVPENTPLPTYKVTQTLRISGNRRSGGVRIFKGSGAKNKAIDFANGWMREEARRFSLEVSLNLKYFRPKRRKRETAEERKLRRAAERAKRRKRKKRRAIK